MPPGCGFEGWQFEQREQHKANIRSLKETLFWMEMLSPDGIHMPNQQKTLKALHEQITQAIEPWQRFGAQHW